MARQCVLIALLAYCFANKYDAERRNLGTYELIDVDLATPFAGCRIAYKALVYSVPTGRVRVRPKKPATASYGWYGLTEVKCGTCVVSPGSDGELTPSSSHFHGIPTISVPLPHASDFPVAEFLLRAHWTSVNASLAWAVDSLETKSLAGVVFISARYTRRCSEHSLFRKPMLPQGANRVNIALGTRYDHECLGPALEAASPCFLRVLAPEEQRTRDVTAIIETLVDKQAVIGEWPLSECISGNCSGGDAITDETAWTAATLNALRAGRHIVRAAFPAAIALASRDETTQLDGQRNVAPVTALLEQQPLTRTPPIPRHSRRMRQPSQSTLRPADGSRATPPVASFLGDGGILLEESGAASSRATSESFSSLASGSTSSAMTSAVAAAAIPGLAKMLKPILEGILKPIIKIVGGVVSDVVKSMMEAVLTPIIDSGMVSDIAGGTANAMSAGLTGSLAPPLTETIADMVLQSVPPSLRDEVNKQVAKKLADALTASLVQTLSHAIPAEIEHDVPPPLADDLAASLTFLLTQSVTQSVVPALTHTLHHNPAEDFYCAYCSAHQLYCNLCKRGGPEQLARAEYYAAYYSRHYANAFSGLTAATAKGGGDEGKK